ncbi:MAG: hypothetical protein HZA17_09240 [Nitrospirae bacterium]|nr:hypothetical protein [Nitrospirota bacterium]
MDYTFEVHPASFDDPNRDRFEVEVLRSGWKVNGKLIVKPVVFEVNQGPLSISEGGKDAVCELSVKQ